MLARSLSAVIAVLVVVGVGWGQTPSATSGDGPASKWRKATDKTSSAASRLGAHAMATLPPIIRKNPAPHDAVAVASRSADISPVGGSITLPNDHGQVWRQYDISPYTLRVTSTKRPEQAIVDWILRETGYEAWHSEPLGILSAAPRSLRVYHTPEMQAVVARIVDRFVGSEAESRAFGLRVATVDHPNWRAKAQGLLKAVAVETPGVGAWVLEREDAAMLLAELRRRSDYREHNSPHLLVHNGQSAVVSSTRARTYIRDVILRPQVWPGFQQQTSQIDEGFSLEFSPLLSIDGKTIDATVKCNIDQVEKMIPVMLDVPTAVARRQRTKIEVPQIAQFRFHERFRWPSDQVLLIGMGMVALPVPADGRSLVPGIPLPLPTSPARADLLVFVQSKGKTGEAPRVTRQARREGKTYHGRY